MAMTESHGSRWNATSGRVGEPQGTSNAPGGRVPPRAWWLISPMLGWLALFVIAPAALLLVCSFCSRDELGRVVPTFTWENYQRVLDPIYLKIYQRSVGYAGLTALLCAAAGFPAAWFIARQPEPARSRWVALVTIPFWTSFLLRTYAWIVILKQEGLLNAIASASGLISHPLGLLYTPSAVIIGLVYVYLPFMILPIYASAEKLDLSLIEAARDLGAPPRRVLVSVILPLVWPGIRAGIIMVFVPALGMFAVTDLLGGARTPLIGNVIQNQFAQARDWPFGSALGVVFMVLFAGAFWFLQRRGSAQEIAG